MKNKTWFTSDLHFFHKNIVKFTSRYLVTNEDSHNEWLIDVWNSQVKPGDIVYHLGDLSFAKDVSKTIEILKRLNGQKILIKGNHDHSDNWKHLGNVNGIQTHQYLEKTFEIDGEKQHVCMFHFPIASWHKQSHGSWHLHGHSHGGFTESKGKMLDVGIDSAYNLLGRHAFFSLDAITEYMSNQEKYVAEAHRSNL